MHRIVRPFIGLGVSMLLFSCASTSADSEDAAFERLATDFIESYIELNPEHATQLGDHRYDGRLNDYSQAGVEARRDLARGVLDALDDLAPDRLSVSNRVDYHILRNHLEGTLFRLEVLREHEWNPLYYNIGGALYSLVAREFAPIDTRMKDVVERLKQVPTVTALAKANLRNAPVVHIETAIQQNAGTISLVRDELARHAAEVPGLEAEFRAAQRQAIAALTYFGAWLERDLLPVSNRDFRLGQDVFRRKLGFVLHSDLAMEEILARAEADLVATQRAMYETAVLLYRELIGDAMPANEKEVIRRVLASLAEERPTNETIVEEARACLEACRAFTTEKRLVTVPDEPINLIVMPEFQRGVAVAYCDAPGPLEPRGKTFYAISPTPADWPEARVTSFFKEYNRYMLHDLTIHEAIPGHYLQLAHTNRFEAPTLIRSVFYSGTFVEGWATYAEQLMVENGYGGPEVRLQQLKMRLRMIINAILDQKIHTAGMSEEAALRLMMDEGFQEEGEAVGKWRRACLTSTQLSTYYVGNIEVNAMRDAYLERYPGHDMKTMHDRMLSFGSPPARFVQEMLGLDDSR